MNGHSSSSMIHSERPVMTWRSSFPSSGASEGSGTVNRSGKRKENVLQRSARQRGSFAQLLHGALSLQAAIRQQDKPIADAFGVRQLMDRQDQAAPGGGFPAQHVHDFPRLPQVETVERLVHEQDRMRREQPDRQHQPAGKAF